MILTITPNPSLDLVYHTESFNIGVTNRELEHREVVGGKGLNAARVAAIMSGSIPGAVRATGFLGEDNSDIALADLKRYGIENDFIQVPGKTRYCYTIIDKDGQKTELNELGQHVSNDEFAQLLQIIDSFNDLRAVSLNGSLPKGLPSTVYSTMISHIRLHSPNAKIILDTSGVALKATLQSNDLPDVIKPNNDELSTLLNRSVSENPTDALSALRDSRLTNIPVVVVSLGSTGAVVKVGTDSPTFYFVKTRALTVVNTEGSGDAVVGGMLYAFEQGLDTLSTIKYGMAAGMANVLEPTTGFVNPQNVGGFFEDDSQILFQKVPSAMEV